MKFDPKHGLSQISRKPNIHDLEEPDLFLDLNDKNKCVRYLFRIVYPPASLTGLRRPQRAQVADKLAGLDSV